MLFICAQTIAPAYWPGILPLHWQFYHLFPPHWRRHRLPSTLRMCRSWTTLIRPSMWWTKPYWTSSLKDSPPDSHSSNWSHRFPIILPSFQTLVAAASADSGLVSMTWWTYSFKKSLQRRLRTRLQLWKMYFIRQRNSVTGTRTFTQTVRVTTVRSYLIRAYFHPFSVNSTRYANIWLVPCRSSQPMAFSTLKLLALGLYLYVYRWQWKSNGYQCPESLATLFRWRTISGLNDQYHELKRVPTPFPTIVLQFWNEERRIKRF